MIPMTFHFAFYRGTTDWHWRDIHTLSLKSCQRYTGATRIIVHYDREDSGPTWDAARAIGGVEWRQTSFCPTVNGFPVADQRLSVDVYRLQTLWEEGGFFCDLDFVFLKSFEKLRDTPAVIGTQCKQKQKLNCGLMGCVPGSAFIRAYLDKYQSWEPMMEKKFWIVANNWPWELSTRHPVTVMNRPTFYPVAWSNKTFWSGGKACLKNAHAIHLWESLKPTLTVDDLRQTVLLPYVESVMDDRPQGLPQILPGVLLSFD
jgi:hypothetical protein